MSSSDFCAAFEALTNYTPFPWQKRLYDRWFMKGHIPSHCVLPTGLGKTSVIVVWLIALAHGARLPRRLVYIVNRRTVVDQATDVVVQIRNRLHDPDNVQWNGYAEVLRELATQLQRLSAVCSDKSGHFLAVSTLRGELADNQEWKTDPARPAIIIGTIDMIGSKLLFSGYGDGRYNRPHHAGLIGQDTLIIHDEAHLTPAFSQLLRTLEKEQQREVRQSTYKNVLRPIKVMELSATVRNRVSDSVVGESIFELGPEDDDDARIHQRLAASKVLRFVDATQTEEEAIRRITEEACGYEQQGCRVLIYVRSPEIAQEIESTIRKKLASGQNNRVAVLTGTIRGYERDQLVESEIFQAFKSAPDRPRQLSQTLYLISTSAGEVGIDLDADHLICDLTTLDSMIQRFGRVNRLGVDKDGQPRRATITVITDEVGDEDKLREQLRKTAEILKQLPKTDDGYDASPKALDELLRKNPDFVRSAFVPSPQILPATDILFDAWALTSIDQDMPGRPEVDEYLHGLTADPPETYVAWRQEVELLTDAHVDQQTLREWFEACPVLAHERLRDRTDRVRKVLSKLLKEHRKGEKDENFDFPVILLNERGDARQYRLSELVDKSQDHDPLAYATVVLPVEAGGLNTNGMLDPKAVKPHEKLDVERARSAPTTRASPKAVKSHEKLDVAEELAGKGQNAGTSRRRERWLFIRGAEGERWKHVVAAQETDQPPIHLSERARVTLKAPPEGEEDEGETKQLILYVDRRTPAVESPEQARFRETLSCHLDRVASYAEQIGRTLSLPENLCQALTLAARWHDRGKDRPAWQRYANNANSSEPLAKSDRYRPGYTLNGYRHEFGSLLEATADPEINRHPERDLILHLIAAHHGWGRPHFEPWACDNDGPRDPATGEHHRPTTKTNQTIAIETIRRFGRLQLRFGRWGLAWLESLLRCADALASRPDCSDGGHSVV